MKKRHFVFLVTNYYPYCSAVGNCIGNIAAEMSKDNKVTVVCTKSNIHQESNELYNDLKIIRFESYNDTKRFQYQDKMKTSTGLKQKYYHVKLQLHRAVEAFKMIISPTSLKRTLVLNYYKSLEGIKDDIDVIIPSCSPFEAVIASINYKAVHRNTKVTPLLFDMFSQNALLHKTKWNKIIKFKRHLKLEKDMFKYSDFVLYMPSWENHLKEFFPEYLMKSYKVEHPLIVRNNKKHEYDLRKDEIRIGCCIDKYVSDDKLKEILIICESIIENNSKCIVGFYGEFSYRTKELATTYPNNCFYNDKVKKLSQIIKNVSFLLYVGNKDIVSFFSYIHSLKPIIYLGHTLNDVEKGILKKYPHSLNMNIENINESINEAKKFMLAYKYKNITFGEIHDILDVDKVSFSKDIIKELIESKNYINVVFAGALNKRYVEADYFVKLVRSTLLEEICRFEFYTAGNATGEIENASKSVCKYGWITKEELLIKLENSNVLLNIGEVNGKQISSKIFDYMSLGKPIIHLYSNDNDINLKYLYKYPASLCIKQSMEDIENNIQRIAEFCAFYMNLNINFEEVENIFSDLKPQSVVETFYKILDIASKPII